MKPEGPTQKHPSSSLLRWSLALLKRLDTLLVAALLTAGLALDPARRFCSEMECKSARDSVLLVVLLAASAVGLAALLWRASRRWWTRAAFLIAAPYVAIQLPNWLAHFGKWEVPSATGRTCIIRFGTREDEVRTVCGDPRARCDGPKYLKSASAWNPTDLFACGFHGVVYGKRLVVMACDGTVARVVAAPGGEGERPVGCVWEAW